MSWSTNHCSNWLTASDFDGSADSGIGNGDFQNFAAALLKPANAQLDLAFLREFQRVRDKFQQYLLQLLPIALDASNFRFNVNTKLDRPLTDQALGHGLKTAKNLLQFDDLDLC